MNSKNKKAVTRRKAAENRSEKLAAVKRQATRWRSLPVLTVCILAVPALFAFYFLAMRGQTDSTLLGLCFGAIITGVTTIVVKTLSLVAK